MPANASIQYVSNKLDSRLRGNDSTADFSFHLGARVSFGFAYVITCIVSQVAASAGFCIPSTSTLTS
jgi:hypothetical protein